MSNVSIFYWPVALFLIAICFLGNYPRIMNSPHAALRTAFAVTGWVSIAVTGGSILSFMLTYADISFFENSIIIARLSKTNTAITLIGALCFCWTARYTKLLVSSVLCIISWYLLINALHHLISTHGQIIEYVGSLNISQYEESRIKSIERHFLTTCITTVRNKEDMWMLRAQPDSTMADAFLIDKEYCMFDGIGPFFKLIIPHNFPPVPAQQLP